MTSISIRCPGGFIACLEMSFSCLAVFSRACGSDEMDGWRASKLLSVSVCRTIRSAVHAKDRSAHQNRATMWTFLITTIWRLLISMGIP